VINENQEYKSHTTTLNVVVGTLIGGLAGALTMLLLAPKSGKEIRHQIQKKSIELRDRTDEIVEDTIAQVRSSVKKISLDGREKIGELKQNGQELAAEQLEHVAEAAQAGKKALQSS